MSFKSCKKPIGEIGPIVENAVDLIPNPNDREKVKELFESDLMTAVMDASARQNKINALEADSFKNV